MDDLEGPYQLLSLASDKVVGVCVYILKIYLFTWKKEGEKTCSGMLRGRGKECSSMLLTHHRALCGAPSQKPWDHDLSGKQQLVAQCIEPPRYPWSCLERKRKSLYFCPSNTASGGISTGWFQSPRRSLLVPALTGWPGPRALEMAQPFFSRFTPQEE